MFIVAGSACALSSERGTGILAGAGALANNLMNRSIRLMPPPRDLEAPAGHSGKQAGPDLIQPFAKATPGEPDARSV